MSQAFALHCHLPKAIVDDPEIDHYETVRHMLLEHLAEAGGTPAEGAVPVVVYYPMSEREALLENLVFGAIVFSAGDVRVRATIEAENASAGGR